MFSELQTLAEGLAEQLGRTVAIDDPTLALLVHTAQLGPVDRYRTESIMRRRAGAEAEAMSAQVGIAEATHAVRVPPRPDLGMLGRICVPIRSHGLLLGYLWLLEHDEPIEDAAITQAEEAAVTAGLIMYRDRLLDDLRRAEERERLRDLLSDDAKVRAHATETLSQQDAFGTRTSFIAFVAQVTSPEPIPELPLILEPAVHQVVRRLPPSSCLYLTRADHALLVAARGPGALTESDLARIGGLLRAACADVVAMRGEVTVGRGGTIHTLCDVPVSYRQARAAIRVAELVSGPTEVADWRALGIYGLLAELPLGELPPDAIPEPVRRLFEVDTSGQLVETLEAYLDHIGDVRAVIEKLHVHRTTLYYRLGRIGQLTGLDLADGQQRLAVHLGIKIAHLTGQHPGSRTATAVRARTSSSRRESDEPPAIRPPD